jgi:tripartite-type tricarboxylate transporter receptor subunit TctC
MFNSTGDNPMQSLLKQAFTGFAVAAALAGSAHAADGDWPVRPITFVVPFTPGGVTDNTSRIIAKVMGEKLGQPVLVDNKPGANAAIAAQAVGNAPADGYTLLFASDSALVLNPLLYKKLAYDPERDFKALALAVNVPQVMVVNAALPVQNLQEFIAYAKANPGKLNFSTAGMGTGTHLTAELFQIATGTKMTHVPYKGSSPALTDLMGGSVNLMFDYGSVVTPFIEGGKLKPLAVTGKSRLSTLPDIPTVTELGFPDAVSTSWGAVFVPAKTPPDIVKRLGDAVAYAMSDPRVKEVTTKSGSVPLGLRDEKLGEFVKSEMVRWREIVERSGAKAAQ